VFGRYVHCLEREDWQGVGELILNSAHKLAQAGAEFLICPDNTIHQALRYVQSRLPLPWLHIAEVVAAHALERRFKCLGLMGTRWLVSGEVYPAKLEPLGIAYVRPDRAEREVLNRIIMDELVCGELKPESTAQLQGIIAALKDRGCDAVVLGCTEIPLLIDDTNSALPTLDSTRLLARAALRRAALNADVAAV
jgi:aspartate racemase